MENMENRLTILDQETTEILNDKLKNLIEYRFLNKWIINNYYKWLDLYVLNVGV